MALFWRARALVSLLLFVLSLLLFAVPHLYLIFAVSRVRGLAPRERRDLVARWQSFWGVAAYRLCQAFGGIRGRFEVEDHPYLASKGGFIVIANHYGAFDGPIIAALLARIGRHDFRAVAKQEVGKIPVVGRAWRELGVAFLARDHRKADVDAVSALAERAREDNASVLIFPEGTVFDETKVCAPFTRILPPRGGGFRRLVQLLPGYHVLSVTIHWHDFAPGKLTVEGAIPPGHIVTVSARVLDPPSVEDAERVLLDEWRDKERTLTS